MKWYFRIYNTEHYIYGESPSHVWDHLVKILVYHKIILELLSCKIDLLKLSVCADFDVFIWCVDIRVEAAVCEARSQFFKGLCFKSDNCVSICENEGYITGHCKGFRRRCICSKDCGGKGDGGDDGGDGGDDGSLFGANN